jgi:hypothetical protein
LYSNRSEITASKRNKNSHQRVMKLVMMMKTEEIPELYQPYIQ